MKQVGDLITIGVTEGARTPFAYPMLPYTVISIRKITGTITGIKSPPGYNMVFELNNVKFNDLNNDEIFTGTKGSIQINKYNSDLYIVNIATDQTFLN